MREPIRRSDDEGIERVLRVDALNPRQWNRLLPRLERGLWDDEANSALVTEDISHGGVEDPEEVILDPVTREVVGHLENELIRRERPGRDTSEPRVEGALAERRAEPRGNFGPNAVSTQLKRSFDHRLPLLAGSRRRGS